MTIISNYHIHSEFCDGKNSMAEMVDSAAEKGLKSIGITSHAHIQGEERWTMDKGRIQEYFMEINRLKGLYGDRLEIYTGMEIDYLFDTGLNPVMAPYMDRLDFFIGSVHALGRTDDGNYWFVDDNWENMEKGIEKTYKGDIRKTVEDYYDYMSRMVRECKPDIAGHMDIIKKNNKDDRFFHEDAAWYKDAVEGFLDNAKKMGTVIEINTGGLKRYGPECFYPSLWILKRIKEKNIRLTVNGDTHRKEEINYYYREVEELLRSLDYTEIYMLKKKEWVPYRF